MKFNQATDYAFRAVLYLANQTRGKVVDAQTISQSQVIPMRFLLKIMPSLIKSRIVGSQRGVGGGYYLAKAPGEITLLDVVEAIEGPVTINKCLIDPSYCSKDGAPGCPVHRTLGEIQEKLVQELRNRNFDDLMHKARQE
ncbi:MAG: Rrf2 family transcriptional regulator [Firmicutes bacterium HGW-Firmicutes-14]|nr:MAG: Rrf2 family transcriptional regulator [Firmicutes bacterium HGW-Firmicutes-14]